jgi:hypothetical protein
MDKKNPGGLCRLVIPLLILMLACSLGPSIPLSGGNGYCYDGLSGAKQEESAIANYQAISNWTGTNITQISGRSTTPTWQWTAARWGPTQPIAFRTASSSTAATRP